MNSELLGNIGLPMRGLAEYVVHRRTAMTNDTNSKHTSFIDRDILFHHEHLTYCSSSLLI